MRADARRSRDRVVEAALALLLSGPPPSMEAVAEAAGVGRVTVFRHFSTRHELFAAALASAVSDAADALEQARLDEGPVEAALQRAARTLVDVSARYGILTAHVPVGGPELDERIDEMLTPVVAMMERGQADGTFRIDLTATWMADVLVDLAHSAQARHRTGRGDPAEIVLTTICGGLARRT